MKSLSVKARITVWFTLLMVLIAAAALGFIITMGGSLMENNSLNQLSELARRDANGVKIDGGELEFDDDFVPYAAGATALVYDRSGTLLYGRPPAGFSPSEPFLEGKPYLVASADGDFFLYDHRSDGGRLWLRAVLPSNDIGGFTLIAARLSFFILPLLVLLAAGGGWLIAYRAFRPIEKIIAAADAISEGRDLSARIGLPPREDEIHRIAAAFDNMFRRLEASFEAEKQFASDASHELRTPTAVILAQCETLQKEGRTASEYAEGIAAIHRQALKMSKLISALLQITRLEQGTTRTSFERADLSELVAVVCRETQTLWPAARLETDIEAGIFADFDVALISRLAGNLLENAFKYGRGKVRATLRREVGAARLTVADNGPGIPPEEIGKIWQRFYRVEKSRTTRGLGLGLALAKQIADIHNAAITAETTPDGAVFTLLLPLRREEGK